MASTLINRRALGARVGLLSGLIVTGVQIRSSTATAVVGTVARPVAEKLQETISIADFGARSGSDAIAAIERAFAELSSFPAATLIIPRGEWLIGRTVDWSDYSTITLRIEPGAIIKHGKNSVILPANVDTGTTINQCFLGSGRVAVRSARAKRHPGLPEDWIAYANFGIGVKTLAAVDSGTNNFAWGNNALSSNRSGSGNIAIGNDALRSVTGGTVPAEGTSTGLGWNNIAVGDTALRDNRDGYENLAIGAYTLQRATTGRWNVAIGHASQILATNAEGNISLGAYTLPTNFGSNNVAIGWAALEAQVTGSNIAIGHKAMNANVSGTLNTAVGIEALTRLKTGSHNVAAGVGTIANLESGVNNTAIGSYALSSAAKAAMNNTAVGRDALLLMKSGSGNTAIGAGALNGLDAFSNCTGVGFGAQVTGSNQIQLGNSQSQTYAVGPVQTRSDRRDKCDIRDTVLGLPFLMRLRPVDFRWDLRDDYRSEQPQPQNSRLADVERDGRHARQRFHHGLVAQDVKLAAQQSGAEFGGLQDHALADGDEVMTLGYQEFIAPLIKAVQELTNQMSELKTQIEAISKSVRNTQRS